MTFFNAGDISTDLDSNVQMNVSSAGESIDLGIFKFCLLAARWTGANGTTGTINIQVSDTGDAGTWEDYPNSTYTITTASGSHYWDISLRSIWFIRMNYTAGNNTAGTFNTYVRAKVPA